MQIPALEVHGFSGPLKGSKLPLRLTSKHLDKVARTNREHRSTKDAFHLVTRRLSRPASSEVTKVI